MGSLLETLRGVREREKTRKSGTDALLWHSNIRTRKSIGHLLATLKTYI